MPRRQFALALLLQAAAAFRPPPTRLKLALPRRHATVITPPSDADKLARDRLVKTSVVLLVPSLAVGAISLVAFPALCRGMRSAFGVATLAVLSGDQGQFIQNFLSVIGILFSLLIGNTYAFCYNQQVMVYMALFEEVSVAKALLEQATLVCQGRPSYAGVLDDVQRYVDRDLKRADLSPAVLLSTRPRDDPLEAIMWQTSVGTPGAIYDTVRWLRRARGERLGAMQRKLPPLHFALLFLLGILEVCAFPAVGRRGDDGRRRRAEGRGGDVRAHDRGAHSNIGRRRAALAAARLGLFGGCCISGHGRGPRGRAQRATGGDPVEPRGPAAGA